jgi:tetratricopeptide (TPR) repeat protein
MGRQIGLLILLILATPHSLYPQQSSELAKEHYQRGDTYFQEGRYQEAHGEFLKALELLGKKEVLLVTDAAEGKECGSGKPKTNKELANELYEEANTCLLSGRFQEAEAKFRKALELLSKKDEATVVTPPHKLPDAKPHEQ